MANAGFVCAVCAIGAVAGLVSACSGSEERTREEGSLGASALSMPLTGVVPIVRPAVRVRAGADNYISVEALANATCRLSSGSGAGRDESLVLHADADAKVSFQFRPDAAGTKTTLALNCEDDASTVGAYTVELEASAAAPALSPPPPKGQLRPALVGDLTAPTDNELVAAGYPPRPDPSLAPREYQTWVADVSRPMVRVPGKFAKHHRRAPVSPGACASGWCTANWVGYVVREQAPYLATQGSWTVPEIRAKRGDKSSDVLAWVGLGGFGEGGGGLWQAGTIQSAYRSEGGLVYDGTLWYELITQTGGCCPMVVFFGTPVLPGDEFSASVWLGDAEGYFGITGDDSSQYLWAYYANVTQGYSIVTSRQVLDYIDNVYGQPGCCISGLNGATAQWIVERPYVGADNGYPSPYSYLADFDSVQMTNAETFAESSWSFLPYGGQSPLAVGMYHCTTPDCSKISLTRPLATPSRGCDDSTLRMRHRAFN